MAITQKQVKEEIEATEDLIEKTTEEKNDLLEEIRQQKDESSSINLLEDEELVEKIDEFNAYEVAIANYVGYLNALHWTLETMKSKNKKKNKE